MTVVLISDNQQREVVLISQVTLGSSRPHASAPERQRVPSTSTNTCQAIWRHLCHCVHVHIYIYIYIYMCVCVCIYIYIYIFFYLFIHLIYYPPTPAGAAPVKSRRVGFCLCSRQEEVRGFIHRHPPTDPTTHTASHPHRPHRPHRPHATPPPTPPPWPPLQVF